MEAAAPPTFVPARPQYNTTADGLILAGAVLGLAVVVMGLFALISAYFFMTAFLEAIAGTGGSEHIPWFVPFMPLMMGFTALLSIVGAILAFQARSQLQRTSGREGQSKAIVAGVLMIVGMGFLGGLLVLIGGILAGQPQRAMT